MSRNLTGVRSRILPLVCMALTASCAALPKVSQESLVISGRQTALAVCSDCHVVDPHQNFGPTLNVSAPSFQEIARRPGSSAGSLVRFIRRTHWDGQTIPITMPAPALTRQEVEAVVTYIVSLRNPQ